jgi:hypothetical protein
MIAGLVGSRNQIVGVGVGIVSGGWVPSVAPLGAFWSCSKRFPHRSPFTSFRASAVGYVVTSLRDSEQRKNSPLPSSEANRLPFRTIDPYVSSRRIACICSGVPLRFSGLNCEEKGVYGWVVFER